MRLKQGFIGVLGLLAFVGCNSGDPAALNHVEFVTDAPGISGSVRVIPAVDATPVNLSIPENQKETSLDFLTVVTRRLEVELSYSTSNNLPDSMSRTTKISAVINVSAADAQGDPSARVSIHAGKAGPSIAYLNDFDCDNLFRVSTLGHGVRIEFTGFDTLLACEDRGKGSGFHILHANQKATDLVNPDAVGQRHVDGGKSLQFFSRGAEAGMGAQFVSQFNWQNYAYILPENHPTTLYLQRLMEGIAANSDSPYITPRVYVVNANIVNAFALPGGYVYVFRGLLDAADSPDEVAGVLAHEWAHVCARHGTKSMSAAVATVMAAYLAADYADYRAHATRSTIRSLMWDLTEVAVQVSGELYLLGKSREKESEADRLGAQYAYRAGYEPTGLASIFKIFDRMGLGGGFTILADHPLDRDRIEMNYDLSALFFRPQTQHIDERAEFASAKAALDSLYWEGRDRDVRMGDSFVSTLNQLSRGMVSDVATKKVQEANLVVGVLKGISKFLGGSSSEQKKCTDEDKKNGKCNDSATTDSK